MNAPVNAPVNASACAHHSAPIASAISTAATKQLDQPMCRQIADLLMSKAPEEGIHGTSLAGVEIFRKDSPSNCVRAVYEPALCLVAQGSKTVRLGDKEIFYGPLTYMVTTVELPVTGQVVDASEDEPYLAIKMAIEPKDVADVVLELGEELIGKPEKCPCGLSIAPVDYGILDAMTRLAKLLDSPTDAKILAPLIKREIIYRALVGPMGAWMRHFVKTDSHAHRITKVIEELKERFAEPLRVSELAESANMSESALYHTFKEVTRMSPMQYQKKLRLHEARRLMLSEGLEASTASYKVGYESPSHFSREYSRLFGAPPRADVMKLRGGERQMAVGVN